MKSERKHDIINYSLILLAVCGLSLGDTYLQNSNHQSHQNVATKQVTPHLSHVHASVNLINEVDRADHHYLYKIGNRKAKIDNALAKHLGQSKPYKKSSDGNYWSYLEDHRPIGNDVFDSAHVSDDGSAATGAFVTATDNASKASGIVANEKVLREHGVKSGINFIHYDNKANDVNKSSGGDYD